VNVTQYLTKIRRQLDDGVGGAAADDWGDDELVGFVNEQMAAMTLEMAEKNEGYHNYELDLPNALGVQTSGQDWDYVLPMRALWRITRMWQMTNGFDPGSSRGQSVSYVDPSDTDPGFYFVHSHKIRIQDFGSAQDLRVQVVKIPAQITRGTLPAQTNMTSTQLRLDADTTVDALNFPHEVENNAYANAVLEITGVNTLGPTHAVSGQIRRVTASAHLQLEAGVLYTVLTIDEAWASQPVAGDTYELHLELHNTHDRYMVLLCAREAWLKKGSKDEILAMRDELGKREVVWRNSIFPRQIANPKVVRDDMSTRQLRARNFDSDEGVLSN